MDAYMEEAHLIAGWDTLTTAPNVIVVPFFIADGLHSFQDIPVLLGIEDEITAAASEVSVFKQNPHTLRHRRLYYSSAIGTEPMLADVILDQVEAFDLSNPAPAVSAPALPAPDSPASATASLTDSLLAWLASGGRILGEVEIHLTPGGYRLCHVADSPQAGTGGLTLHTTAADARGIARTDGSGKFRPLKTAPNLRRGWELFLTTPTALHQALDYLYPAALANWFCHASGHIPPRSLKDMLARQTGMYRITGLLREAEAQTLVASICHDGACRRKILWSWDGTTGWHTLPAEKTTCPRDPAAALPALPLLCTDACPLLIGPARPLVKDRLKAEADADAQADAAAGAAAAAVPPA